MEGLLLDLKLPPKLFELRPLAMLAVSEGPAPLVPGRLNSGCSAPFVGSVTWVWGIGGSSGSEVECEMGGTSQCVRKCSPRTEL